jgi:hypothetical protein
MLYFYPKKLVDPHDIEIQRQVCKGAIVSKPFILITFLYAYARRKLWKMWRRIECNNFGRVTYCDTDSLAVVQNVDITTMLSEHIGLQMGQLEVLINNANMVVVHPKVYAMRNNEIERIRAKGMDRRGQLFILSDTVNNMKLINGLKQEGWTHARNAYNSLSKKSTHKNFSYDVILKVFKGMIAVSVYWYFKRYKDVIHKVYSVKVLKR